MDLFDRAEDESNGIKRAARYHYALAARLAWSAGYGLRTHLAEEGSEELWRLVTVDNLWGFCLVAAGYFAVSSVPVVGSAVNLYLSYYGLKDVWERLQRAGTALDAWYHAAHEARSKAELESASALFAKGVATGGLLILEAVVSKGSFKLLGRLLRKFPVPAWFRQMVGGARKQRDSRVNQAPKGPEGRKQPAAPLENPGRTPSPLRGRDFVPALLSAEGAKQLAEEFPVAPVVAGVAAAAALAGGIWWGLSASGRSR